MSHIQLHAKSMVVVDHHVSAVHDVAHIADEKKIFDMERSGMYC